MAQVLLLFDVSDNALAFKKALSEIGYLNIINTDSGSVFLPTNSLYHSNKSLDDCVQEALAVGREQGAFVQRCVAVEFNPSKYSGISGS